MRPGRELCGLGEFREGSGIRDDDLGVWGVH